MVEQDLEMVDGAASNPGLLALIEVARAAREIVAFTGAGISTESGIPDYRGEGRDTRGPKVPSAAEFRRNPEVRRAYWESRRTRYPEMRATAPNAGHLALAVLERAGLVKAIITQNIDGLHQAAGSDPSRVVELHGTTHVVRCLDCGTTWDAQVIHERLENGETVPACDRCGGPLRAATVLFGESVPREALDRAIELAKSCDMMLVVGTSLVVNPAAKIPLIAKRSGARLAIVNRTLTPLDALADVRIMGESGPTLSALATALLGPETSHVLQSRPSDRDA